MASHQGPGGPGYPPSPGAPPQAPAPAGLSGLFRKWLHVTTKPGVASFTAELPTANWADISLSILGLAVLSALAGFIGALGARTTAVSTINGLTPDQQRAVNQIVQQFSHPQPAAAFLDIVIVPFAFYVGVGILLGCAKLLGGTGTYVQQAYAFSLYLVPVQGLAVILGLVPGVGGFLSGVLGLYGLVLAVLATAASQRLSIGRSVVALVLFAIAGLVVVVVYAVVFAAIFVATGLTH
jgi:Yip1 domain